MPRHYEIELRLIEKLDEPSAGSVTVLHKAETIATFPEQHQYGWEGYAKAEYRYEQTLRSIQGRLENKTFRITGLSCDYPVIFLRPIGTAPPTPSPLITALENRGFGDSPEAFLFMWIPSSHAMQAMYYDHFMSRGANISSPEYRSIFQFVSKNWNDLNDGTPLELFNPEEEDQIEVRVKGD